MEKINHDRFRTAIRALVLAAALGGVSLSHGSIVAKYQYVTNTSGVRVLVPVTAPGEAPPKGNGQLLWDRAVNTDGGQPKVAGTATQQNPSGRPVPVSGTARIPGPSIGRAVGRAIAKSLPGVGAAIALAELADEIGFQLDTKPDGTLDVKKQDPSVCTVSPCYQYGYPHPTSGAYHWFPTKNSAADFFMSSRNAVWTHITFTGYNCDTGGNFCTFYSTGGTSNQGYSVASAPPSPVQYVPSTDQEFIDAVATRSGWPTSSKVNELLRQDIESGGKPEIDPITVTGPATTPGAVTTTTNPTNNTTTTSTTTHHHSYAGNTVTTTNSTTTITINNTTGDTISSSTTVSEPEPEKEKCEDGDQTLGCADADIPQGEIPRETKTITYSEENVFGSGSCPPNVTSSIATLGATYTVWNWDKTCDAALPLRALVIALASFAALLIVMPGKVET